MELVSEDAEEHETDESVASSKTKTSKAKTKVEQQAWPASLPEQVRAVANVVAASATALDVDAIAAKFKGRGAWKKGLPTLLQTLEALGRVHSLQANGVTVWSS